MRTKAVVYSTKRSENNFPKPLDNRIKMCYNKYVKRRGCAETNVDNGKQKLPQKNVKNLLTNPTACGIIKTLPRENKIIKDRFKSIKPKGIDTMENKKMTKAQKFAMLKNIPAVKENPMLVEFIDHEVELLSKKNSADKKPTAQQTANEGIKTAIVEGMEVNRLYTITEIIKEIPECADMTNQRVSALVRQLVDADKVKRTEDKRKAYFSLIVGE